MRNPLNNSEGSTDWISIVSILFVGAGIVWLDMLGIVSGSKYYTLFFGAVALLFVVRSFSDSKLFLFKKHPFKTSKGRNAIFFLIMLLIPMLLFGLLNINTAKVAIPLAADEVNGAIDKVYASPQSLMSLEAASSDFVKLFITVFSASALEEFTFGYVAIIVFSALGFLIYKYLGDVVGLRKPDTFVFVIALIFSVATFTGIHMLNSTYDSWIEFGAAAVFRLVLNLLFWLPLAAEKGYVPFSGLIGLHQGNNLIYFITVFGATETIRLIFSGWGWLIVLFYAIVLIAFFRNFTRVPEAIGSVFKKR
jgi:hypothetical protein